MTHFFTHESKYHASGVIICNTKHRQPKQKRTNRHWQGHLHNLIPGFNSRCSWDKIQRQESKRVPVKQLMPTEPDIKNILQGIALCCLLDFFCWKSRPNNRHEFLLTFTWQDGERFFLCYVLLTVLPTSQYIRGK